MNRNSINAGSCMTQSRGWLDKAAIFMAVVCGIHCLMTPLLLVALPIIGSTFWTSANFHYWMLALVIPTTTLAVFSGCRRHKDRTVALCAVMGLCILASATAMESFAALPTESPDGSLAASEAEDCAEATACASCCAVEAAPEGESLASLAFPPLSAGAFLNLAGGLFLIAGHFRNFRLCRAARCCDGLKTISR